MIKFLVLSLCVFFLCFFSTSSAFAQTSSPVPSPQVNTEAETKASGSGVLNSFIAGFDWISSGLVFYTPALMENTIKLQDGTELAGMGNFRDIFYDIAVPLFVLITSAIALSHISNDNAVQLKQFFRRLVLIVALFIITPSILSYSIQFVNLLNAKIIAQNSYNLSTFVNDFLSSFMQIPMFSNMFGGAIIIPSWNTVLQLIILIISVGFLLIGFIYIIFQAIIRFIALLILSVIFPVVLPFALSGKTENIANTYFKTWFSFLIQQPAFVLGFAIVSAILTSILQAHNNSIGTLFVYSGALIFLGGINVFIGRIFGDGWSVMSTNAQSLIGSRTVQKNAQGMVRNEKVRSIPAYAGTFVKNTLGTIQKQVRGRRKNIVDQNGSLTKTTQTGSSRKEESRQQYPTKDTSTKKETTVEKSNTEYRTQTKKKQPSSKKGKVSQSTNNKENVNNTASKVMPTQKPRVTTKKLEEVKPVITKRTGLPKGSPVRKSTIKMPDRKK